MKVKLTNVRLAFPALWEAKTVNGEGKPAFSGVLLIEPGSANEKIVNDAIDAAAVEKWGAKAAAVVKQLRAADKVALHDGDLKANYDGFAGMVYVSARNAVRPLTINRDKSSITEADGIIYAGCYVNASIDVWAQDNKFGKRVNATLGGVQFARDGDAFAAGASASEDDFDDLAEGANADADELV
ncbi:MAG TPA: DUF2815 family protein [Burkholderiaceae bacterium]